MPLRQATGHGLGVILLTALMRTSLELTPGSGDPAGRVRLLNEGAGNEDETWRRGAAGKPGGMRVPQ
jgi:hypothetical protein